MFLGIPHGVNAHPKFFSLDELAVLQLPQRPNNNNVDVESNGNGNVRWNKRRGMLRPIGPPFRVCSPFLPCRHGLQVASLFLFL